MAKVQGIGGIFLKAKDPKKLRAWYAKNLGVETLPHSPWGADDDAALIEWRDKDDAERTCYTVFEAFPADSDFFHNDDQVFMLNFRVDDLDGMIEQLKAAGVQMVGEIEQIQSGRLARCLDPEGSLFELWEPKSGF